MEDSKTRLEHQILETIEILSKVLRSDDFEDHTDEVYEDAMEILGIAESAISAMIGRLA